MLVRLRKFKLGSTNRRVSNDWARKKVRWANKMTVEKFDRVWRFDVFIRLGSFDSHCNIMSDAAPSTTSGAIPAANGTPAQGSSDAASNEVVGKRVRVKRWNAVAFWSYG